MKILEINDNEEDKNNFINMVLKMLLKMLDTMHQILC